MDILCVGSVSTNRNKVMTKVARRPKETRWQFRKGPHKWAVASRGRLPPPPTPSSTTAHGRGHRAQCGGFTPDEKEEARGMPGRRPCRTLSGRAKGPCSHEPRATRFVSSSRADLGLGKRSRQGRGREAGFTAGAFRGADRASHRGQLADFHQANIRQPDNELGASLAPPRRGPWHRHACPRTRPCNLPVCTLGLAASASRS